MLVSHLLLHLSSNSLILGNLLFQSLGFIVALHGLIVEAIAGGLEQSMSSQL